MKNYSAYFSEFLKGQEGFLHFRAHSHHFWPDVTKNAVLDYFEDARTLHDDKWEFIFGKKIPEAQQLIADQIGISHPENIAFAPNTHELFFRLLSSFLNQKKKIKILTSDSEFLSFDRQVKRLLEGGWVDLQIISTFPFDSFVERVVEEGKRYSPDIVFISQVFFNSGVALFQKEIEYFAQNFKNKSTLVIDGYHGFMALPLDLSKIENDLFYLAGGYKYLGAGEGCCFMTMPKDCTFRPLYTGWFADLSHLDSNQREIYYPENALRFAGATMDFSALYKVCKILQLYNKEGISVKKIHERVQKLQEYFLQECQRIQHQEINEENLIKRDLRHHGHFLSFTVQDEIRAKEICVSLKKNKIFIDTRGNRIRFGFALYHNNQYQLNFSGV